MSDEKTSADEHADADPAALHGPRGWSKMIGLRRQLRDTTARSATEPDLVDTSALQLNSETDEGESSVPALDGIEEGLDAAAGSRQTPEGAMSTRSRRRGVTRAVCFGVLPVVALLVALGGAYLKYLDGTNAATQRASVESVDAAKETTIAMLSYTPETAEASLTAARDRLTGTFRESYSSLTRDVVIPGATEQNISATATVPAAATVTASADHAVALVFVNQAIMVDNAAPSQTSSVVQVTLEKSENRWLVSGFDPK